MTAPTTCVVAAFAGLVTVCSGAATPQDARAGDLSPTLNASPELVQWQSRLLVTDSAKASPDMASPEWESALQWKRAGSLDAGAPGNSTPLRTTRETIDPRNVPAHAISQLSGSFDAPESTRRPVRDPAGPRRGPSAIAR